MNKKITHMLRAMRLILIFFVLSFSVFFARTEVKAAINEQINYQGRLLDSSGAVVPDGTYNITFKIYSGGDGAPGGSAETLEWTETRESGNKVTVTNGYFSVNLGSVNDFGSDIDWNEGTLWLGVEVGGTGTPAYTDGVLSPYKRLSANPYSLNSLYFNGLQSTSFLQLAQGIQTDSSTSHPSIYLNKTGGTANILQFQRGGTDVFTIGNGGSVVFKTTTDSVTGFQVNDADGGTPVFNIDTTNERVGIGTAAPSTALDISGTVTATLFSGSGASLTNLNASNLASGTVPTGQISGSYTGITGVGTVATGTWNGTDIAVVDGGTGASTAADARTNLGLIIGTNVQGYDVELNAIAGLTSAADRLPYFNGSGTAALATFTTSGRNLIDDASTTAQRTTLGLGTADSPQFTAINIGHASDTTLARSSAGNLTIEGNLIYRAGGTDVPVTDGGTGASDAGTARTNLGLGSVATLSSIAGSNITDNTIEEVDLEVTNTPTDNYILSYDSGTGGFTWVDDANTTYSAGNDLDLSGTTFDIESQLDSVTTISRASSNLTLQTTTSGDILVNPAGDFNVDGNSLYVDSSTNLVGIGTSSPQHHLHVNSSSTAAIIQLTNSTTGTSSSQGGKIAMVDDILYISNEEPDDIQLLTNNSPRITIEGTGNVGIGTTGPSNQLTVNGSTDIQGHTAIGSGASVDGISLASDAYIPSLTGYSGALQAYETTTLGSSTTNYAAFGSVLKLNPSSTPSYNQVYGTVVGVETSSGNSQTFTNAIGGHAVATTHAGTGTVANLQGLMSNVVNLSTGTITEARGANILMLNALPGFASGGGTIGTFKGINVQSPINLGTVTNNYGIHIEDQSATGSTESYNLYSRGTNSKSYYEGKVGIGEKVPAVKLHVKDSTDTDVLRLQDSDGTCNLNPESGSVTVACSSDKDLKTKIHNADSALEDFNSLKIRDYTVKASGDKTTGVIAQEVKETNPELVNSAGEDLTVELPNLWKIVKAIQELDNKVESKGTLSSVFQNLQPTNSQTLQNFKDGSMNKPNSIIGSTTVVQNAEDPGNLSVAGTIVTKRLQVKEDAIFEDDLFIKKHAVFSRDIVGEAIIKTGDKTVRIEFEDEYEYHPIVTLTPQNWVQGQFRVIKKGSKGFTIELNSTQNEDVAFDWHSFASDEGKVFISDDTQGTVSVRMGKSRKAVQPIFSISAPFKN